MLHALLTLALAPPIPAPPATDPLPDHGKIEWFRGNIDEAIQTATTVGKPIFVDFWTESCAPCRLMDAQAFSDPEVLEVMKDFVCVAIDGESPWFLENGITERYNITVFPTLVFLEPNGAARDKLGGYHSTRSFLKEARRIAQNVDTVSGLRARIRQNHDDVLAYLDLAIKLQQFADQQGMQLAYEAGKKRIKAGGAFDPNDVEMHFEIAKRYRQLGDLTTYNEHIDKIKELDPEGKSRPSRRLTFEALAEHTLSSHDDTDMRQFLEMETDREMLHEGWHRVANVENFRAQKAKIRKKPEEAAQHRYERRACLRRAFFKADGDDLILSYGQMVCEVHYDEYADLTDPEKTVAVKIARQLVEIAGDDTEYLDTLACALMVAGEEAEALQLARRCVELEPHRFQWKNRLAMFESGKVHK